MNENRTTKYRKPWGAPDDPIEYYKWLSEHNRIARIGVCINLVIWSPVMIRIILGGFQ